MAEFEDRNSVAQVARVTGAGDLITSPTLFRWAAEGKIFEAGYGLEDTAIDSEAAIDDQAATFSLQAPASTSLLVIPLLLKLMLISSDALSIFQVLFTKPAGLCAASLVISSGAALTSKHSIYRTDAKQTAQQATAKSGVTVTALTAPDFISYHLGHVITDVLTTGLVSLGGGPSNVHTFNFLEDGFPHIMTSGAAMLVYAYQATTDATWLAYMKWAEVEEDDLY